MPLPVSKWGHPYGYTGPRMTGYRLASFDESRPDFTLAQAPMVKDGLFPAVRDQGQEGSCVCFATTTHKSANDLEQNISTPRIYSPQEIYYHYRDKVEHDTADDTGCGILALMELVKKDGVCVESLWPYTMEDFDVPPSAAAYADAANHKFSKLAPLTTLEDMILCVASGYGFVAGIAIFQSFEDAWDKGGVVPMPGSSEKFLGGHGVFCNYYDRHRKIFIFQNSWGTSGGLKNRPGYFSLPFDFMTDGDLVMEVGTGR